MLPRDILIVLCCHRDELDGATSARAAQIMLEDRYDPFDPDNVKLLWKGYFGWVELSYPVE